MLFSGSSVLIVGATGGLGSEFARQLSARGAQLTLTSRSQHRLSALKVAGAGVVGDITDHGTAESFVQTALNTCGRLDGIIYAAGAVAFGPISGHTDEVLDELWEVNARGWMSVVRAGIPPLAASAERGGSPFVVSLSGVVAEQPTAGMAAYSSVKAALHSFGVAAGRELRRQGILAVDARPGHTETQLSQHPLVGDAPSFPPGLPPEHVVSKILSSLEIGARDLPSSLFRI